MRAVVVTDLAGPSAIVVQDVAEPDADGLVLIDVKASGVCFPDLLISYGKYQIRPEPPFVPGTEVAGVVLSAGMGYVSDAKLTAATAAAGGLGIIAGGMLSYDELEQAIHYVKDRTDASSVSTCAPIRKTSTSDSIC